MATTYPDWRWGMKLTPDRLNARAWNSKVKAVDEVNTSGVATLQDDDELFFAADANALYFVILTCAATVTKIGGATPSGISTDWTVPAGTTGFKWCQGPHGSTSSGTTTRDDTNLVSAVHGFSTVREYIAEFGGALDAGPIALKEHAWVQTAATAGNVQWRWAPRNANSNPAQIDDLSTIQWVRVG